MNQTHNIKAELIFLNQPKIFWIDCPIFEDTNDNVLLYQKSRKGSSAIHLFNDCNYKHVYCVIDQKPQIGDWAIGYAVGFKGVGAGHFLFHHDGSAKSRLSALCTGTKKVIATSDPDVSKFVFETTQNINDLIPTMEEDFYIEIVDRAQKKLPIEEVTIECELKKDSNSRIFVAKMNNQKAKIKFNQ